MCRFQLSLLELFLSYLLPRAMLPLLTNVIKKEFVPWSRNKIDYKKSESVLLLLTPNRTVILETAKGCLLSNSRGCSGPPNGK